MKCFYSDAQAVGICRSCGRGLSPTFITEFPHGLACKNRCEREVQDLIATSAKAKAASAALLRSTQVTTAASGVFSLLAGGGFLYFNRYNRSLDLINFMGGAFILFGLYSLIRGLRRPRPRDPASEPKRSFN